MNTLLLISTTILSWIALTIFIAVQGKILENRLYDNKLLRDINVASTTVIMITCCATIVWKFIAKQPFDMIILTIILISTSLITSTNNDQDFNK